MDIGKLTKSQIVLLTLLVSFVTSIATGIVTVSLMQQAPQTVAETVNRVIENTIEEVATSTKSETASVATTQQKTVVVDESDLVAQAVKQVSPSVVRIYSADQTQFLGLGLVVDASGTVAADIGALGGAGTASIQLESGAQVESSVTSRDQASGLLFLTPATSTSPKLVWTPAALEQTAPSLGDLVVVISGTKTAAIAEGLITQILPADPTTNTPETIVTSIDASSILPGSPVIDTDGNVVGVSTGISRASSLSGFVPAAVLSEQGAN